MEAPPEISTATHIKLCKQRGKRRFAYAGGLFYCSQGHTEIGKGFLGIQYYSGEVKMNRIVLLKCCSTYGHRHNYSNGLKNR
jgi:hypothetical protein